MTYITTSGEIQKCAWTLGRDIVNGSEAMYLPHHMSHGNENMVDAFLPNFTGTITCLIIQVF